jgi:hypothetical protein
MFIDHSSGIVAHRSVPKMANKCQNIAANTMARFWDAVQIFLIPISQFLNRSVIKSPKKPPVLEPVNTVIISSTAMINIETAQN